MNEVQGPTPAGTSRPYRNLAEALRAHRIAAENHSFLTKLTDAIGIASYIDRGRYIEAIRRGGGTPLHIGKTYTNGFSEAEVIIVGTTPLRMQLSEGRPPYYYVEHPSKLAPAAAARAKRPATPRGTSPADPKAAAAARATKLDERDYGVCDTCFMVRTPAGGCGCD